MPKDSSLVVALDGPSGSGKSSVARRVAARLGLRYLDTGAMYRAVTWWALHKGVDLSDQEAVADLARNIPLEMGTDPLAPYVRVAGNDVTAAIRESWISAVVSMVATNLAVREELVRRQRDMVAGGGVVAEGRDITTVVAPEAQVRVLLTAREDTRLRRRAADLHGRADSDALAQTRDQVIRRDAADATVAAFLEPAPGVEVIDSSDQTVDETVAAVLALVEHKVGVRGR